MSHDQLSGVQGKFLDERCNHCDTHAAAFKIFSRCGRCRVVKYCSSACQKAAWPEHKKFCHTPIAASEEEQQAVRARMKSGSAVPSCPGIIAGMFLQREFFLRSGKRHSAISGEAPSYSVFELPDHFELAWPMHDLLPNELAPLNAVFPVKTTMRELRQYTSRPSSADPRSIVGSLAKFVANVPRIHAAMLRGQPEALKLWQNGCNDMCRLLYYRWAYAPHELPQTLFALVPEALRPYELNARSKKGSGSSKQNVAGMLSRVKPFTDLSARFFILRMPANPFAK
jgi:hypothetical protein